MLGNLSVEPRSWGHDDDYDQRNVNLNIEEGVDSVVGDGTERWGAWKLDERRVEERKSEGEEAVEGIINEELCQKGKSLLTRQKGNYR